MKRQNKPTITAETLPTASDTRQDKVEAAKAWAKFLLEQYRREQALLVTKQSEIIEIPTNHDRLNA